MQRPDSGPFKFLWKSLDVTTGGMASELTGKIGNWAGRKIQLTTLKLVAQIPHMAARPLHSNVGHKLTDSRSLLLFYISVHIVPYSLPLQEIV